MPFSLLLDLGGEELLGGAGADLLGGAFDTGATDLLGGAVDSGIFDTGAIDPGMFDTGMFDTGMFDPGTFDTGTFDTGTFDPGTVDTGGSLPDLTNVAYDDNGNLLPGYEVDPATGTPTWTGNTPTPSLGSYAKDLLGSVTGSGGGLLGTLGKALGFGGNTSSSGSSSLDWLLPLLGAGAAAYGLSKVNGSGSNKTYNSPDYYGQFANQPTHDFSAGFGTPGPAVNPVAAYNPQLAHQAPNQNQYVWGGQPIAGPVAPAVQ